MTDQQTSNAQERMRQRLADLKRDYQRGEAQLQRLMQDETATRDGLLRASGAIRILEEILSPADPDQAARQDGVAPSPGPGARVTSVP
ncbi:MULTISPECIES: hypothetical protein [unclassified Streptomyces]|uniref:hypothetical protein n=1 Tax=unclassified Streptomyces TaxID=2593676 RepID=UPI002E81074F|nr:hypothetical protein [Streptomyces sp. NBC_00569]WUB92518.1 hypothetical protein OHO83_09455 [Streptomyces sp. NBC_00569]